MVESNKYLILPFRTRGMFLAFAWRYPAEGLGAWLWAEGASRCLNFKRPTTTRSRSSRALPYAAASRWVRLPGARRCACRCRALSLPRWIRPRHSRQTATVSRWARLARWTRRRRWSPARPWGARAFALRCGRTRPTPVPGFGEGAARFASLPPKRSGSRPRVAGSECSPTRTGHLAFNRGRVACAGASAAIRSGRLPALSCSQTTVRFSAAFCSRPRVRGWRQSRLRGDRALEGRAHSSVRRVGPEAPRVGGRGPEPIPLAPGRRNPHLRPGWSR